MTNALYLCLYLYCRQYVFVFVVGVGICIRICIWAKWLHDDLLRICLKENSVILPSSHQGSRGAGIVPIWARKKKQESREAWTVLIWARKKEKGLQFIIFHFLTNDDWMNSVFHIS